MLANPLCCQGLPLLAAVNMQFHHLKRREFISLIGGAAGSSCAWPFATLAQAPDRRPRIAFLGASAPVAAAKISGAFIEGMRALGYSEGRDFEMDYRWAEGYMDRLPALAQELVRLKADVIVTANIQAIRKRSRLSACCSTTLSAWA
jgi:putative tryptophan/tyrosine transport system substrate-binding protein